MSEECVPPISFSRLLGFSGFGNAVGSVKVAASNDIQEIKFLGGCLMWKMPLSAVVGFGFIFFVIVWYDLWKYRERDSAIMFSVPLLCCEYRDVLLLTCVHPIQRDTVLCDSAFTGSKDDLCIHPSALELSVNSKMCDPCTICRIVM